VTHPFITRFVTNSRSGAPTPWIVAAHGGEILEATEIGGSLTNFRAQGGSGGRYQFELLDDGGGPFELSLNGLLTLTGPLDYALASSYTIRLRADDQNGSVVEQEIQLQVINQPNGPLTLDNAEFIEGAAEGTLIGTLGGFDPEFPNERVNEIWPDFGYVAIGEDGRSLRVGAVPYAAADGPITLSIWTDEHRYLEVEITVKALVVDPIYRLATRQYGAGYNAENVALVGDGSAKTYSASFVNESGRQMDTIALAFQGWGLVAAGTSDVGNNNVMSSSIVYNGVTQNFQNVEVRSGNDDQTADLALTTPIPAGATFTLNISSIVANGAKYLPRLGFAGVLTKAKPDELRSAFYGVGDSIATNNGAALMNASVGKAPVYHASIIGTTAQTYGANNAANFARQASLAARLGVEAFVSNFSTNDMLANRTPEQILGDLGAMKTLASSKGIKWIQATMLPRVIKKAAVAVTSLTSSGNLMTAKVADANIFTIGQAYTIAGATPAGYNGTTICAGVDAVAGEATFVCAAGLASPATGSITIVARNPTNTVYWQQPINNNYNPGEASARGQFNKAIRNGAFDGYIDWADAVEPYRDSGRFAVAGEKAALPMPTLNTVLNAGVRTTTRFTSDYASGSNTMANGLVQFVTGADAGLVRGASNNSGGDTTLLTALTAAPAVGDKVWQWPGVCYAGDDGTHLRVPTGGKGGQIMIDEPTSVFLDTFL